MPSVSPLLVALAGASLVSAHGYVNKITVAGKEYEGWNPGAKTPTDGIAWQESATDNGFVAPSAFTTSDIACHRDGKAATQSAKVAAGGKITLAWNTWPDSHKGPVLDYLAACDGDCSSAQPGDLSFFKIDEAGLDGDKWASDDLIANGNSWDITIPESLKAGFYVLRHEIIALHSAGQEDGAQAYPQCINLEVTGGGDELPAGTPATSLYKPDDAGIKVNIYQSLSSYEIPGPALAFGGDAVRPAPTSSKPASATATAKVEPTSSQAATPTAPATVEPTSAAPVATAVPGGKKPSCKKRRHARQVKQL